MIGTDSYHLIIDFLPPTKTTSDYRFSELSITEIDIKSPTDTNMIPAAIEPIKAKSIGKGVIRLYREFEEDPSSNEAQNKKKTATNPGDNTMVAILAIPTYFTATDLLGYIGEVFVSSISHIRILKSDKANRFMVLIKFRDIVRAAEFQYQFDGKSFNSMEPETSHVIFVSSVQIQYQQRLEGMQSLIPFLLSDPFTSTSDPKQTNSGTDEIANDDTRIELPTCPVCLEKMDSAITGLLTIPCQHTFHCQCLSRWRDDSCPVCRYSHNLTKLASLNQDRTSQNLNRRESTSQDNTPSQAPASTSEENDVCMDCQVRSNLWICLICGNVGCSRYAPEQHSLKHFVTTGHCFAMEINTSRVWDYAGDNYVHRLVTNESDGKLVELPDKSDTKESKSLGNAVDKIDAVGFEYSQLLISQLASQREYYQDLLDQQAMRLASTSLSKSRKGSVITSSSYSDTVRELEMKIEDLTDKVADLTTSVVPSLKEKIQKKEEKIHNLSKQLCTANALNEAFSNKIEHVTKANDDLKVAIEDIKSQNNDLNDQVRDLMFFLESREKFKDESEDVKQGTVVIPQQSSASSSSSTSAKKKKKKAKK
ncbi:hypothetical protein KGF57_001318 [Candida theae]|uniref:RING-type domain-containing protein n=1 Tax=Candida theae TaxID=1198502 RepID=A0AAD5BHA5_9ASCO|nr:uncharacterized protein KGF57_001318 [Candida theae]KAI5963373.1 hypothetical protein KGF57_001318 [Candida theae]